MTSWFKEHEFMKMRKISCFICHGEEKGGKVNTNPLLWSFCCLHFMPLGRRLQMHWSWKWIQACMSSVLICAFYVTFKIIFISKFFKANWQNKPKSYIVLAKACLKLCHFLLVKYVFVIVNSAFWIVMFKYQIHFQPPWQYEKVQKESTDAACIWKAKVTSQRLEIVSLI